MADKIPLSEYAERHNMHYKTALRRFKEKDLEGVIEYVSEPVGISGTRYFVLDETKDYKRIVDKAKNAVDSALNSVNKLKQILDQ